MNSIGENQQSKLAELERLGRLRNDGLIDEEEFKKLKEQLINDVRSDAGISNNTDVGGADPIKVRILRRKVKSRRKLIISSLVVGAVVFSTVAAAAFVRYRELSAVDEFAVSSDIANVRSKPTATSSSVVYVATKGEKFKGIMVTNKAGASWLKITQGEHKGGYIWVDNLIYDIDIPLSEPEALEATTVEPDVESKLKAILTCNSYGRPVQVSYCLEYVGSYDYPKNPELNVTINNIQTVYSSRELVMDSSFRGATKEIDLGSGSFSIKALVSDDFTLKIDISGDGGEIIASRSGSDKWVTISSDMIE